MGSSSIRSVGFIGLGAMGAPMAKNLTKKFKGAVHVFDARPAVRAAAAEWGARPCSSSAEVAAMSDLVLTMLPDDAAVRGVCIGEDSILDTAQPGLNIIDFSTIGPWTIEEVASALAGKGTQVHAGAATLGVKAAEIGELAVYLDESAVNDTAILDVVRCFAASVIPTSGLGSAKVIKLINNLMVAVNVAATAEAVALSEKAGLPADKLVPLILKGSGASYALANHIARNALTGDVGIGKFGVNYILKDLDIALEMARRSNQTMFFGTLSAATYRGAKSLGFGDHYYPIVLRWMERAAGMTEATGRQAAAQETAGR